MSNIITVYDGRYRKSNKNYDSCGENIFSFTRNFECFAKKKNDDTSSGMWNYTDLRDKPTDVGAQIMQKDLIRYWNRSDNMIIKYNI